MINFHQMRCKITSSPEIGLVFAKVQVLIERTFHRNPLNLLAVHKLFSPPPLSLTRTTRVPQSSRGACM